MQQGHTMEIWLDTSDKNLISKAKKMGILHGVTTNPSIIASSSKSLEEVLNEVLQIQAGPVTAQVTTLDASSMIKQAEKLFSFSSRIIVKIPATEQGLEAITHLSRQKLSIMSTCGFHPNQVILSCLAGASYIAPYFSRLHDSGEDAQSVLKEMLKLIEMYKFPVKLLAASLRSSDQVRQCMDMGIQAVTLKEKIFAEFTGDHPLTLENLDRFAKDWENAKPSQLLPEKEF